MIIERVQVEEGFLDGLDLTFSRGLNVLIGPRGSGKTSIIELIRFCLDVPAFTEKTKDSARQHALSILGSGRVTVTINDGSEFFNVSRSAEERSPTKTSLFTPPLILSQNEIESVGLDTRGRLKTIDSLRPESPNEVGENEEEMLLSYIRSQSEERKAICAELASVKQQLTELNGLALKTR